MSQNRVSEFGNILYNLSIIIKKLLFVNNLINIFLKVLNDDSRK